MLDSPLRVVTWNINALAPTIRNIEPRYGSYQAFLRETLNVDIACFQETKLVEGQLSRDLVLLDGFQSFWASSRERKGYSGVVTYASETWAPVHAQSDCLGSGESDIDREGRIVMTDHGTFVLLNIYVPNGGDRPARARVGYKLDFLRALRRRADAWRAQGREVMIVGDLNLAAGARDVHPVIGFDGLYSDEENEEMRGLLAHYTDVWRMLHPDTTDQYTVWNERTSARAFNRGLRIDYVLCSQGLVPRVASCEILGQDVLPPKWSDHAALLVELRGVEPPAAHDPCLAWTRLHAAFVDVRQRSIRDLFARKAIAREGVSAEVAPTAPGTTDRDPTVAAPHAVTDDQVEPPLAPAPVCVQQGGQAVDAPEGRTLGTGGEHSGATAVTVVESLPPSRPIKRPRSAPTSDRRQRPISSFFKCSQ